MLVEHGNLGTAKTRSASGWQADFHAQRSSGREYISYCVVSFVVGIAGRLSSRNFVVDGLHCRSRSANEGCAPVGFMPEVWLEASAFEHQVAQ